MTPYESKGSPPAFIRPDDGMLGRTGEYDPGRADRVRRRRYCGLYHPRLRIL